MTQKQCAVGYSGHIGRLRRYVPPSIECFVTGLSAEGVALVAGSVMLRVTCAHDRGIAVADLVEPSADPVRANLLDGDPVLFSMYMSALDEVLRESEIRAAFDESDLSVVGLRMKMVRDAVRVLGSAPQEFADYLDAVASESSDALDPHWISHGPHMDPVSIARRLSISMAVVGALITVGGVSSFAAWPWTEPLVWAGLSMLTLATVMRLSMWVLSTDIAVDLRKSIVSAGGPELVIARDELMAAVSRTELQAQVRMNINAARRRRLGPAFAVASSPGLSEVYDSTNRVPTDVAAELDGLIARLGGASIGVAGPRGSGKSTLIRKYCEDDNLAFQSREGSGWLSLLVSDFPERTRGDLRCMVAAPVDYVARDFVLHLFAAFCRAVIGSYKKRARNLPRIAMAMVWIRQARRPLQFLFWRAVFISSSVAVLYWEHAVAREISLPSPWIRDAAITLLCVIALNAAWVAVVSIRWRSGHVWRVRRVRGPDEKDLATSARKHLSRVRYLQTHTSGWSGTLHLPGGAAEGQHSRSVSRAEQPLSYPEIVDDFRNFARGVAADVHRRGDRVFIGVDELDKIGSAEQAERFLNEIKGIFGIPHLYFMVSVSDDALTAFERRGLPLRDAFDSSFDEIIHVGPLSYAESRRLLYRRVIGLTEPYVALCHCLGGGLARDVIRTARQVVRTASTLIAPDPSTAGPGIARDGDYISPAATVLPRHETVVQSPTLGVISTAIAQDELGRKLRAVSHVLGKAASGNVAELQDTFYDTVRYLVPGRPILSIVDIMANPGHEEPPAVASLRLDFSAYAYYCATLQEVFTDRLDSERMIQATSDASLPGSFDALAAARNAFALDTMLAWRLITQFRKQWQLETREPAACCISNQGKRTP